MVVKLTTADKFELLAAFALKYIPNSYWTHITSNPGVQSIPDHVLPPPSLPVSVVHHHPDDWQSLPAISSLAMFIYAGGDRAETIEKHQK